jgi:hypothetical protein
VFIADVIVGSVIPAALKNAEASGSNDGVGVGVGVAVGPGVLVGVGVGTGPDGITCCLYANGANIILY